jgi:hypothetical protein
MMLEMLDRAFSEARVLDWDGEGGLPVEQETYGHAAAFLRALPDDVAAPEIRPDGDGDLQFEWDHDKDRVFTVAVSRGGTLYYAGLFGSQSFHGSEVLQNAIPETILSAIMRISSVMSQRAQS